jgi:hypothetical protein
MDCLKSLGFRQLPPDAGPVNEASYRDSRLGGTPSTLSHLGGIFVQ